MVLFGQLGEKNSFWVKSYIISSPKSSQPPGGGGILNNIQLCFRGYLKLLKITLRCLKLNEILHTGCPTKHDSEEKAWISSLALFLLGEGSIVFLINSKKIGLRLLKFSYWSPQRFLVFKFPSRDRFNLRNNMQRHLFVNLL